MTQDSPPNFTPQWTCKYKKPKTPLEECFRSLAQRLYAHIRTVAFLLDSSSQWLIPFFPPLASLPPELHFGIDSVVGAVLPAAGDVIGLLLGLYQVILSLFFGISFQTFIIMCGYLVIDALIGVIPIVGDFMDVAFKANIYNLHLLEKELKKGRYAPMIVFASPNDWIPRPNQRTGWRQRRPKF